MEILRRTRSRDKEEDDDEALNGRMAVARQEYFTDDPLIRSYLSLLPKDFTQYIYLSFFSRPRYFIKKSVVPLRISFISEA